MNTASLHEDKFNEYLEDWSTDTAIWFLINKPISKEGYEMNFLPRLKQVMETQGEARIGLVFDEYKGYEKQAVASDMEALIQYGKHVKKIAMVNPPEKVILQFKFKEPLISGEIQYFDAAEKDKAIAWLNE